MVKVKTYRWFKYDGKEIVLGTTTSDHRLHLYKGEIFGYKKFKDKHYMVDKSDLNLRFEVKHAEADRIIQNSKGWSGKVGGETVKAGTGGRDVQKEDSGNLHFLQIDSSNLRNAVYDKKAKIMYVEFHNGACWAYEGVTPSEARNMEEGRGFEGSQGRYFIYKIRSTKEQYKVSTLPTSGQAPVAISDSKKEKEQKPSTSKVVNSIRLKADPKLMQKLVTVLNKNKEQGTVGELAAKVARLSAKDGLYSASTLVNIGNAVVSNQVKINTADRKAFIEMLSDNVTGVKFKSDIYGDLTKHVKMWRKQLSSGKLDDNAHHDKQVKIKLPVSVKRNLNKLAREGNMIASTSIIQFIDNNDFRNPRSVKLLASGLKSCLTKKIITRDDYDAIAQALRDVVAKQPYRSKEDEKVAKAAVAKL